MYRGVFSQAAFIPVSLHILGFVLRLAVSRLLGAAASWPCALYTKMFVCGILEAPRRGSRSLLVSPEAAASAFRDGLQLQRVPVFGSP